MRLILTLGCLAAMALATGCDRAATADAQVEPAVAAAGQQEPSALERFQKDSEAIIANYLRDNQVVKVQLGAGSSRIAGWLNTDIEPGGDGLAYLDATKRFPFEDGSVHYMFSEHVIEHLTYEEGQHMMAEAFRVLAPGGKMRISTPDLMQFIGLFDKNPSEDARAYIQGKLLWHEWPKEPNSAAIILNLQMSSWGHKFMYDYATLTAGLTRAGFRNPQSFDENISNDDNLRDLEERDSGVNERWSAYETMSVEVEKPAATTTS